VVARLTLTGRPSGLFTLIKDHLAGGASRLAALLLPQILPVTLVQIDAWILNDEGADLTE
jgi:hypothetical protein